MDVDQWGIDNNIVKTKVLGGGKQQQPVQVPLHLSHILTGVFKIPISR